MHLRRFFLSDLTRIQINCAPGNINTFATGMYFNSTIKGHVQLVIVCSCISICEAEIFTPTATVGKSFN